MLNVRLYPKGYVGPDNVESMAGGRDESITQNISYYTGTFDVTFSQNKEHRPHDGDIGRLNQMYYTDALSLDDIYYREKVLVKAKDLFTFERQIKNFDKFITTQIFLGELTKSHVDALKEIITFIKTGKWGLRMISWERILDYNVHNPILIKSSERKHIAKEFDLLRDKSFSKIDDVLIKWVSHDNGYGHLLGTLNLLFGDTLTIDGG